MLNNNPTISNTYTYNRRFEQFEVTCKGGIARHHEVFINYGSYGTTDTLLAYGNVLQQNYIQHHCTYVGGNDNKITAHAVVSAV